MASMDGKVVLITGATSGIGKVTARELAKLGATVAIVGRDAAKTAAVLDELRRESGSDRISSFLADLSQLSEVRRLAAEVKARHPALHVLLNNAGAVFMSRKLTPDGFEATFGLNHLSFFLLTHELLDLLKSSAPARIINVASRAHQRGKIDFDDLMHARRYAGFMVYSDSKLANLLFTYELARKLEGSRVTVNALHPGVVATNFGMGGGLFSLALKVAQPLIMVSPEEGARTSIYLASSPEVEGVSGQYFVKSKATPSVGQSNDRAIARRLWDVSEKLTGTGTW
jgi:NAD(P)-dependent dehydrogenase (short-subunit alcohol dehydrogenase family)